MESVSIRLSVHAGPHVGREFIFDRHDTFLVGRAKDAHFQLNADDPFFSRRHFLLEINPPRIRILDLKSRNGTLVNGIRMDVAELKHGDEIKAGHTIFKVAIQSRVLPQSQPEIANQTAVQEDPASVDFVVGELTVPGYRIDRELGRGGMGVVYQATRLSDGKGVAIKTIIPAVGVSTRHVDRFIREARILQKLNHPNIVAFYEIGKVGPMIYLVMELVKSRDVEAMIVKNGPMAISMAVRIVCQMLSGIGLAHKLGYVHRDIKPANLLIGGRKGKKQVKLADFGLARVYESSELSGLTMQGDMCGTPAFMAPEQVTHYRDVKPAADQYSAAATLYRLLTACYVHNLPKSIVEQMIHILTEPVVPIEERLPDIPTKLAAVIHKALNFDPSKRYPDVLAFRKALLRWIS